MKISWNCLNQIIDLKDIHILDVIDKLTLAGFEVENIIKDNIIPDTFFDISITANRQDITGFIHIATEVSALFELPIKKKQDIAGSKQNIQITEYSYVIKDININQHYYHITKYLHKFNFKITHTILDLINFINLKWGQEIKVYDLKSLNKKKDITYYTQINIDNSQEVSINGQILTAIQLDSINREENITNILLINHSKNNFPNIYSSYAYQEIFKVLNLISQQILIPEIQKSSSNIEKGINQIICEIETIKKTLGPLKHNHQMLLLNIENIIKSLERLNFRVNNEKNKLKIEVPKARQHDIVNEIDIIEEIGRIYGFNNFIDNIPTFEGLYSNSCISQLNQTIRRILRSIGLHEIMNYSLHGTQYDKRCSIINPLNQDQSNLRNNLIENIVASKLHNINQDNESFEVFEIGTIFIKDSINKKYKESTHLSCLIGNDYFNQLTWQNNKSALTWSQAKGQIENLFEKLNAQITWSTSKKQNNFIDGLSRYIHPTRNIYINYKNKTIGIFCQLNYRINNFLNTNYNIYFFEIDIIELSRTIKISPHLKYIYSPYPSYPKITRDLSLKLKNTILMQHISRIINEIKKEKENLIESVKILNEYCNNNQIKTICLRITYRCADRTLTNEEVEILDNIFKERLNSL